MILRHPRGRATTVAIAAVIVGLPAAITACQPSSNTASNGAHSCAAEPGVTADSVKVGLIYPDSGPAEIASAFKASRSGVEARIGLQNDHGGVEGRKINLVWGDDQSDAQTFSQVAHNMIDDQKVFGLVATSIVLDQSADWLQKQNVPVTGTATSANWSNYTNVFSAGNLFNTGGTSVFGDFVKAQGGTKALVVVDPNIAASKNLALQFVPSLQSRGIQIVDVVTYTNGVTNPARVADQLRKSGADTLVGAAQSDPFIDIYSQAKANGARIKVALNATGFSPGLLAQRGADMAGMSILSSVAAQDSAPMKSYLNAISTYAPELTDPTDELALAGYVAADEMIQGIQLAGVCPTRQAFIQKMRQVTNFTSSGMIPPIDLTKPKQPILCENFMNVDATGRTFAPVQPPAALNHDGYWCGVALQ
ncbi:ABC transporter substrate-binding protein [Frankia sp. AgB1.9]|uniref:ABC transporter substrate-binding protein n=1 Tax=unclassified Frankia TaxID=2632575 RepID=UPI0019314FDD|nr:MULTISPECIES: ABC transporter substrate-binding protein [unclassified Frankia]MBL7492762.1 ABC transporter substrate-binding protein [Frankia sp. AgW1.1]MBL7552606.1 ABC transporter substrate-binding protein [Frankia sp. AgB1.9]MBL7620769.1 ABC transporter substrate-binding protein [Frankia sp. AgB1.8]